MAIVKLGGRLGNQLFQVAFGVAQSLRSGSPLLVDWGDLDTKQRQGLEAWVGPLDSATPVQVDATRGSPGPWGKAHRLVQRITPTARRVWILQRDSDFEPGVTRVRSQAYFDGYWQSYRYFEDQEGLLRGQFRYRGRLSPTAAALATRCQAMGSVSIHVRRGDFVDTPFAVVGAEYFRSALARLRSQVGLSEIYVFSDDPGWCRGHLDLGERYHLVTGEAPETDLHLMAQCHHHVVGASTFGWWGAWLGTRDGSLVVAPNSWFPSFGHVPRLADVYPSPWILW